VPKPGSKATKRAKTTMLVPRFRALRNNQVSARPQSIRTQLTYHEFALSINPAIGAAGVYVFAANGLYDPNITGVGHQPLGFDQYMALYNEYLVIGSTIKVTFNNSNNAVAFCGIFLEDFNGTSSNMTTYVENGNGVYSVMDATATGGAVKTLTHLADIQKFSAQKIDQGDVYVGTAAANPTDTHFYHVVIAPFDGATDLGSTLISVEIRYDVVFRDPAITPAS